MYPPEIINGNVCNMTNFNSLPLDITGISDVKKTKSYACFNSFIS